MELSPEALAELKEIHRAETGRELTDDETLAMARHLFRVYRVLFARKRQAPPAAPPVSRANL